MSRLLSYQASRSAIAVLASLQLMAAVSGCSWQSQDSDPVTAKVATLADLQPAVIPDKTTALPQLKLDDLVTTYREVLTVTEDPETRLRVLQRLAGLEMQRGEEQLYQESSSEVSGTFTLAIEAYETLLRDHPQRSDNDVLLYQLSKAYDLGGETDKSLAVLSQLVNDFPGSAHYVEAQFRRAEILFSQPDYRAAEQAYAEVVIQGKNSSHYQNSLYMYGWSLFKQERYRAAIKPFSTVLDLNVPADNQLDSLERGRRELTQDVFKILSIVFSYLDGATTIEQVYRVLGEQHYIPLLYDNLAKLYLKQERFRDSGETYRVFIDKYPQSEQSPVFYARLIDAYIAGGFPEDVLAEKENFIAKYGIASQYWQQSPERSRDYIRPFLEQYLPELARHYHAQAQAGRKTEGLTTAKAAKPLSAKQLAAREQQAIADYVTAGNYYQQFIETFPANPQLPEMQFLLAESRFEAGVYDQAIDAYEIVAYQYPEHKRGVAAGYAAIVAYGRLLAGLPAGPAADQASATMTEYENWQRLKIASQLRFASVYNQDPRAAAVLVKSAEELLALQEYQQAVAAASQLDGVAGADKSLRKTAWLVTGHSEFELQQYANAEQAYSQTLQLIPAGDAGRTAIVDRLAASVYKQAELALVAGTPQLAVEQFLRVSAVAPGTAIAVTAQYDAANALLDTANFDRAIDVLARFRKQHPDNPLTADIPAKMVVAYQQTGQWAKAAEELTAIYQSSDDIAVKQESLYQAAELYEQAGDVSTAILRYRSYANAYPQPFAAAMEARYKLSELYRQTEQGSKQRFWLRKMIAADKAAGAQRSDRSRYLAVFSSSVLADDDFQAFKSIRLSLPLKSSLKKKKKALNKTLAAYQAVSDYGVEEFATLATFRIAAIYNQLSQDLMNSQRPKNLDELALEQYELLLEEQAYPFEEKAIDLHEVNIQRSWDGVYDSWVKESFTALKALLPARYGKQEKGVVFANEIY
jgi:tetratricopeptide (TPR) repeat protein